VRQSLHTFEILKDGSQ